jgi:hypothetical protein
MRRLLALLCLLLPCLYGPVAQEPSPAPLGGRTADERGRLALSAKFYIELSIGASEISICHSGVPLATFKLQKLTVGTPRIFWIRTRGEGEWIDDIWEGVHLFPEKVVQRVKIIPGDASTTPTPDKPGVIPPTLSELTPVPPTFIIRAAGGRALYLDLEGDIPGAIAPPLDRHPRWHDFLAALGMRETDSLRLRAKLPAAEGAALFRSFPEGEVEMLVLP